MDPYINLPPLHYLAPSHNNESRIKQSLPNRVRRPQTLVCATFSDDLAELPQWGEQHLFESLNMFFPCFKMIDLIIAAAPPLDSKLDMHLISVSDGSAFDRSMSFGWTMCLLNVT